MNDLNWMQIVSALALIMFIVILFPATLDKLKNSPQGTSQEWMGFISILVVILLFIAFLISLV
ncbi:MAG: hypothetical protein DYH15_00945 [Nitrosomonas sp. PRO4]|nr:hypothetical protein [Nitrosomonas sp. PRO4]